MKTFMLRKEDVEHKWYVIDAEGQVLGKVAALAASVLRGKNKPTFTPYVACGDNVIIINAEKVVLTGNKLDKKMYYNHSGYPGGLRERTARTMKEKYPVEMVERAVKNMLPKNRLGRDMYRQLFVYAGNEHKHEAQKPERLEVK
ncbi:MAG: 50S ribosomal protein L13 [Bacillales bacterium]|nr:50S ribosomal protein L13 [Bacillales bacterium]MCI7084330.1 50S ribosomal protein L13 [Mycoplasmatota bacterium]MCI7559151.1 50S ribosomal protein L13 [Clostridium sp.]